LTDHLSELGENVGEPRIAWWQLLCLLEQVMNAGVGCFVLIERLRLVRCRRDRGDVADVARLGSEPASDGTDLTGDKGTCSEWRQRHARTKSTFKAKGCVIIRKPPCKLGEGASLKSAARRVLKLIR
jgi:hypothetical protein